ncbi:MAG: HAMP domain-containing methyl-accepting chemotaxis protein [Marinilabilia sp.]
MNEVLKEALTGLAVIPVAFIILRVIFGRSIMFGISFKLVILMIYIGFASSIEYLLNDTLAAMVTPLNVALGTFVFWNINRTLRKPLAKAIQQLSNLAQGDLDIDVEQSRQKNELGILNNSIFDLTKNLKQIILQIDTNSSNLNSASHQVSSASEQLSQSANEQAGSVEEVSSTMEEISSMVEHNAQNARNTEKVSSEANQLVLKVAEKAGQAAMANADINTKINMINDIAFQTNILALNAAIEASAASDQGRGFSAVATEVRKLAEKSKSAAGEITSLSNKSLELANETGEIMKSTIPKIEQTTQMIREVNASSAEQTTGTNQVKEAVQQFNNISQQNAASSEELASSAEELLSQAEQLKELIAFFKSKDLDNPSRRDEE